VLSLYCSTGVRVGALGSESTMYTVNMTIKRVFIANIKGTFFEMSESAAASKRR